MAAKKRHGSPTRRTEATVAPHVVRVRLYPLVADCVEAAVRYGIRRVYKYNGAALDEDALLQRADTISDAVLSDLTELIEFDPEREP